MLIGLVDADLLDNGTRHPNLALLKIAGFLNDNKIDFVLLADEKAEVSSFDVIYMSKVFTFTKEPDLYLNASEEEKKKFRIGGTGYYATEPNIEEFKKKRQYDMVQLEEDPFLCKLKNLYNDPQHPTGINMAKQMPYYDLYKKYIDRKIEEGANPNKYKDYLNYSIGFLTRKCYRHCPFCVNRADNGVEKYSELEWFYEKRRPYVYFWDDNFLAADKSIWKPILQTLIEKKISFQFRQGLDERQFVENPDGEEMVKMLSMSRYHGDFIFAFDNWKDREVIEKALRLWKRYNPSRPTKFYLFCGFHQDKDQKDRFYTDICELFWRIRMLMQYGCCGYVMRHEDYHKAPLENFYVQVARWCNQPAFFKKMSFWDYCYRNQSYWEQRTLKDEKTKLIMSFPEFERALADNRFSGKRKLCLPLRTILGILEMFPEHRADLIEMFNYKFSDLRNSSLWETK